MSSIQHVFLDRDGTLIIDKNYLCDPEGVELLPGAARALSRLQEAGSRLYLVSNQSGIGRGFFDESACKLCQDRLADLLQEQGVHFVDMAYCPHSPEDGCDCRKPGVGLWKQMAALYDMKAEACAMIGDKKEDVQFGLNAGFAATVLVLTGHGAEHAASLGLPQVPEGEAVLRLDVRQEGWPHAMARDMEGAVSFLLSF